MKARTNIDWILFFAVIPIVGMGLLTMNSFSGETAFFARQLVWAGVSIAAFFFLSSLDLRFLRNSWVLLALFGGGVALLALLLVVATAFQGSQRWFDLGFVAFQPSDPMKLVLILILAKYFSRRHVEIAHVRHIIVSGIYALIPFVLVFLQPDFGSAMIFFIIWLGIVMVSGISKKHVLLVFAIAGVAFSSAWFFVFEDYQQDRIRSFLHPLADIQGAGYNAYQSTIAVGSGELFGKGVGFGTQSRLSFLPEYQTDFIFAAFAEEWGFLGVTILFLLFGIVIWRILANSIMGATNFETLFGVGLAILFMSHFIIHVGMNIGLLPVTGTTIPFMSYGGSHLLTGFAGLGILMSMRRYGRTIHKDDM